jgi:predicted nucleic acid-binding protein
VRKIFLDSSVIIAACGSRNGASHAIIVMAEIGLFKVLISEQVIEECDRNITKKLPTALPILKQILSSINPEILPNPAIADVVKWETTIEPKDTPILAAALLAQSDRLLSLNTKDFTPNVAQESGLKIQTPSEFIQEIRSILTQEL